MTTNLILELGRVEGGALNVKNVINDFYPAKLIPAEVDFWKMMVLLELIYVVVPKFNELDLKKYEIWESDGN